MVQISEHPQDSNKLLIGYSSGLLVLWDLRAKDAEARFKFTEVRPLNCIIKKRFLINVRYNYLISSEG